MNRKVNSKQSQALMEFTFSMVLVALLSYGLVKVWQWTGIDLAERRITHDDVLTQPISEKRYSPLDQIDPNFYELKKMNAVVKNPYDVEPELPFVK